MIRGKDSNQVPLFSTPFEQVICKKLSKENKN